MNYFCDASVYVKSPSGFFLFSPCSLCAVRAARGDRSQGWPSLMGCSPAVSGHHRHSWVPLWQGPSTAPDAARGWTSSGVHPGNPARSKRRQDWRHSYRVHLKSLSWRQATRSIWSRSIQEAGTEVGLETSSAVVLPGQGLTAWAELEWVSWVLGKAGEGPGEAGQRRRGLLEPAGSRHRCPTPQFGFCLCLKTVSKS